MKDSSVLHPDLTNDETPSAPPKTRVMPRSVASPGVDCGRRARPEPTADVGGAKTPAQPSAHAVHKPKSLSARLESIRDAATVAPARETPQENAPTKDALASEDGGSKLEKTVESAERNNKSIPKAANDLSEPHALKPEAAVTPPLDAFSAKKTGAVSQPSLDVWQDLPRVSLGARLDGQPAQRGLPSLIEYFRADPIAKGFDLLRTRLVQTIRAYGWRKIAVVAPTTGCGATFTAVNLALSLSRIPGSRTVLMDMNQRAPGVADALGLRAVNRLDDFLQAKTRIEDYFQRPNKSLAVGLAATPSAYAAESLQDPLAAEVLDDMVDRLHPDLVIYDMPAMLAYDDMAAFLPEVDGVLLVVDGTQTLPDHISACERILDGQTRLLGVVLNRGRSEGNTDIMV